MLAWASVRYSDTSPNNLGAATAKPARTRASAFDLVAAICNIIMGVVLVMTMIIGIAEGTRVSAPAIAFLLAGMLFMACGIVAIAMRKPASGKFPTWLRVVNIVTFSLDALVALSVMLQAMFQIVR